MLETMISLLHLDKVADSIVGNENIRGLSGGEKRRVSNSDYDDDGDDTVVMIVMEMGMIVMMMEMMMIMTSSSSSSSSSPYLYIYIYARSVSASTSSISRRSSSWMNLHPVLTHTPRCLWSRHSSPSQ